MRTFSCNWSSMMDVISVDIKIFEIKTWLVSKGLLFIYR